MATSEPASSAFYRTIWRWHFYAGLLVMPLVLVLALSGATYLFKPQIERWEERQFQGLSVAGAALPSAQVAAALRAYPGATLASYRLPGRPGDAPMLHLALPQGDMRDVFVSPQGAVLGGFDPDERLIEFVRRIHGQLLLGNRGSWLVELAASWAIVMIITGLILWYPRGGGFAGVVWPRLRGGSRLFWRDLHAVTGFWVAGLALLLLFTGLPWAQVWGSAFKVLRSEMGWIQGAQDWTIGGRAPAASDNHGEHDHAAMVAGMGRHHAHTHAHTAAPRRDMLDVIVARAARQQLAFPVLVVPPGAKPGEGGKPVPEWTVKSDAQNRPLRVSIRYDSASGREVARSTFAERHAIDRAIAYGIAWHEGQLLGWFNQLVGVLTALMLVTITVSGFVLWRRRKPPGVLGAPPGPPELVRPRLLLGAGVLLALPLPLFAASLLALWLADRLLLPRLPAFARWLGVSG